jgi:alginate O-acetyltransferase complex protein AlgI
MNANNDTFFILCGLPELPRWALMWLLAGGCFFLVKALVAQKAAATSAAFMFLWPGMDAAAFHRPRKQVAAAWGPSALLHLTLGFVFFALAHAVGNPFWAGWIGMVALVMCLHFGLFRLVAAFWRHQGRDVVPIMSAPLLARSVAEFWGQRWNLAFRDAALCLLVRPLQRNLGLRGAVFVVFLVSGLLHEIVISAPTGAGYGGPTLYFLLQGLCVMLERGCPLRTQIIWRARTWVTILLPLPLLFPEDFVLRVMHPFFQTLHLLPS